MPAAIKMYSYHLLCLLQSRRQRNYFCIIISILMVQIISVRSQDDSSIYHISPLSNGSCGSVRSTSQHSCFNLSEVATAIITERSTLNVSLILAPGNHTLTSNLTIAGYAQFSMKSEFQDSHDQHAVINCGVSSRLQIYFSACVHIHGITLNRCVENEVKAVKMLIIEDSILSAIGIFGRALIISNSTMIIEGSALNNFTISMTSQSRGGTILSLQSDLLISNSMFSMNRAGKGGVMYCLWTTVVIKNSTFAKNGAIQGGVLYLAQNSNAIMTNNSMSLFEDYLVQWNYFNTTFYRGNIFCIGSNFTMNFASKEGGVIHCTTEKNNYTSTLTLDRCIFAYNNASFGAVFLVRSSNVIIHSSNFQNNKANKLGGVGHCRQSILLIKQSIFFYNQAGAHAGVLYLDQNTSAVINSGKFYNNSAEEVGGCLHLYGNSNVVLIGTISYRHNSAHYAVIGVYESSITVNGSSVSITDSTGLITLVHSMGYFAGYTQLKHNEGSIQFYDSNIVISGHLVLVQQSSYFAMEGGCMTLFLSKVSIIGNVTVNDSTASNGGGILSISSTITVDAKGTLTVTNNVARDTGGGIYLYHSLLRAQGLVLVESNKANAFGGGIHCITSTIVLIHNQDSQYLKVANNEAVYGGGICLEASSKFYVKHLSQATKKAVHCIKNSANYGGAIYVVDNTTTGICASSQVQTITTSLQTECFFQILKPMSSKSKHSYPQMGNYFLFVQNFANISGGNLFGGLLDRCTVYNLGKNTQYSTISTSTLSNTTSKPVRVCICVPNNNSTDSKLNCAQSPPTLHVTKGRNFTLKIAAVDHVKQKVKATIYGLLESRNGHLREGQQKQAVGAACTRLNFSIISPVKDGDHLVLYADGPCKDLGISALRIPIKFDPCHCPTGFEQDSEIKDRCVCGCNHLLKSILPHIECDSETLLITKKRDYWLSIIVKNKLWYFLTYTHCPSDYCHPSTTTVYINLNTFHGSDAQCAFNHTGVLCGHCHPNLTLSLGSSRCIECPQIWPAITVAILVGTFLAGLALVALILVLNLTVASGTLNGVIFYANIITIDQQLFMPFKRPNFHSVFIAWLNLDLGFDVCFFKGLNAYAKAWLQLTFPLYIIFIVAAVIVASNYSKKFANLVSRYNPVATLATLILLSYAKFLHNIIEILSYAILQYIAEDENDSFTEVVWLHDGSIAYLKGTHIPLFIVAILIVIAGFIYTLLLLSWQWLVKFSNKVPFLWVRNTKLSSFMDAYHAPYMARNRYWTGLLLLARVILYLTAAINVSGEPSVNLLAILLVIGCISLLHAYSGISIYKKWPLNVVEFTTIFNILAFTAVKFYIQMVGGNHAAIAYTSVSIQFALFVFSLLYHLVLECHILDYAKKTICRYKSRFSQNLSVPLLLDNNVWHTAPSHNQTVTYSEVMIKNPEIQLTSKVDSEREGLSLLLSSTDNSQV